MPVTSPRTKSWCGATGCRAAHRNKAVASDTTVQFERVGGDRAFWLSGGPHFFLSIAADGQVFDPRRWVGDALLCADGPVTYRFESAVGRQRTIELAESVP